MSRRLRILPILMLPVVAAFAGCSMFDAWDTTTEPPPPQPTPREVAVAPRPHRTAEPVRNVVSTPPTDDRAAAHFNALLGTAVASVSAAEDMSCRLVRTEMVGDILQKEEVLDFQQRFSPQSLRLKWVGERNKGRDLLYVTGQNDGKVLVKEPGAITNIFTGGKPVSLALDSPLLKAQSRYLPDVAGYNNLVKRLRRLYDDARPLGLVWVSERPSEMVAGRRLQTYEVSFESVLLDSNVRRMIVTFDVAASLPTHTVIYDGKNQLVEDYDWQHLRLNVGLTDADFRFAPEK